MKTEHTRLFTAALAARLAVMRNGARWPLSALELAEIAVAAYGEDSRINSHAALVAALKEVLSASDAGHFDDLAPGAFGETPLADKLRELIAQAERQTGTL